MSLQSLMIHSFDVYRPTFTHDTSGGKAKSYSLAATDVPCNVQPAPSTVMQDYGQRDEVVTHTIFYLQPVAIGIGDRLVFKGGNYRVVGKRDTLQKQTLYRVDVEIEVS